MLHRFVLLPLIVSLAASPAFGQEKPKPDPLEQNAALAYWQAFAMMPGLSEAEREALKEILNGKRPIDETAKKIVQQSKGALHYLHRGAKMERAAWGVAWEEGLFVRVPHLSKALELVRVAAVRAQVRFDDGKQEEAVLDLLAAMTLGRHVGKEGVIELMQILLKYAIETTCLQVLAEHLPAMDAKLRADLKQRLASLPKSRSLADAMQGEKDVVLTWLIAEIKKPNPKQRVLDLVSGTPEDEIQAFKKLDDNELLPATRRMGEYYDRMIAMVKLPPREAKAKEEQMMQEIKQNGAKDFLSRWLLLGNAAQIRHKEARNLTRLAMLEAGIAVLENGKKALEDPEHHDPFGDGPFTYQETDSGFVLTSDWEQPRGNKLSLTFGKK